MTRIEKKLKLSDEKFKRRIGTTKHVFQTMLNVLQIAYDKLHEAGGKPPDLTVGDKLLITLKYYREYTGVSKFCGWLDVKMGSLTQNATSAGLKGLPTGTPIGAKHQSQPGGFRRYPQNLDTPDQKLATGVCPTLVGIVV
jgi:hypothetical protein